MVRKAVKIFMAFMFAASCCIVAPGYTHAENKNPVIFVHGLLSYGGYWANATRTLRSYGYQNDELHIFLAERIGTAESYNMNYAVPWIDGIVCPPYYYLFPWGKHGNSEVNAPDLADLIKKIANTSSTGKVDIIAHSNGVHIVREALDDDTIAALVDKVINIAGWNDAESVENESNPIRYLQEKIPNSSLSDQITWYAFASRCDGALKGQSKFYLSSFENNVGEPEEYRDFGCFFDAPTFFAGNRKGANLHFNAKDHDLMTCDPSVIDAIYIALNGAFPPEPEVQSTVTISGTIVDRPYSYMQVPFTSSADNTCTISLYNFNPTTGYLGSVIDSVDVINGTYSVSTAVSSQTRIALKVQLTSGLDTYTDMYWFADAIFNDMTLNLRPPEELDSNITKGKIRVRMKTAGEYLTRGNWFYDPTVDSSDRVFGETKKPLTTMEGSVYLSGVVNTAFSNKITLTGTSRSTNYQNYGSTNLYYSTIYKWKDGYSGSSDYENKDTKIGLSLNGKDMVYIMVNGNDRYNQINNIFFNIIPAIDLQ